VTTTGDLDEEAILEVLKGMHTDEDHDPNEGLRETQEAAGSSADLRYRDRHVLGSRV